MTLQVRRVRMVRQQGQCISQSCLVTSLSCNSSCPVLPKDSFAQEVNRHRMRVDVIDERKVQRAKKMPLAALLRQHRKRLSQVRRRKKAGH